MRSLYRIGSDIDPANNQSRVQVRLAQEALTPRPWEGTHHARSAARRQPLLRIADRRRRADPPPRPRPAHHRPPGQLLRRRTRREVRHALDPARLCRVRHHHRRPDVRALPGSRRRARRPHRPDPRLLPDRQDLGDDAGRPHGLGRVFRPPQPSDLRHRSGLARPLRRRPVGHQRGPQRQGRRGSIADGVLRRARERLGDLPLRQGISADHARHALSRRGPGRILEADGAGQPEQPAHAQSDRAGAFGTGAKNRRHRADEPFAVGHLPVSDRGAQPQRHRGHGLDRARRLSRRPPTT